MTTTTSTDTIGGLDVAVGAGTTVGELTLDHVDALSVALDEPEWLRERRRSAWAAWQRLPMPTTRDEKWRFTNMRRVRAADAAALTSGAGAAAVAWERAEHAITSRLVGGGLGGRMLQVDGGTPEHREPANLPAGVIFAPLAEAVRIHGELVQRHWGTAVPVGDTVDDKFVALQEAMHAGGVFVYVPRNVQVAAPLLAQVVHATDGGSVGWRALVVLEEGAQATFVEEFLSAGDQLEGFSNAVVELVVGAGARLTYATVQDYAVPVTHFATHRVLAARDARVDWATVGLGASLGKSRMEARLMGAGSEVMVTGTYFLDGRQELDYDTQQFHEAPNAMSDLAFKGALADRARSVWRGMIAVSPGAQGTDSYQENRNLLLSSGAHADSIPGLQIEANEVRCTHGATISKVDAEQLFYLQSRGIPREEAVKMVVRGFFAPALDRIADEPLREAVRDALWARMTPVAAAT